MPFRILVVEDDPNGAEFVVNGLRQAGYTVELAMTGPDALHMAISESFDALILDRNLPGLDGLSVLKALRAAQKDVPILILSALAHADERVNGLRAGAGDYLGKPFSFSELELRLQNLLKTRGDGRTDTTLRCADLEMDLLTRRVSRGGRAIDLLQREFQILEQLLRHKDKIVTHMSRLRKKLEDGFAVPLLHTVRSVGYRLAESR